MKRSGILLIVPAIAMALFLVGCTSRESVSLEEGFVTPPADARPRVWWHWMNGNISMDGAMKDIEWMKRIGVGGFHAFDAGLTTPQIVDHRVNYMDEEWKEVFRASAEKAVEYGMELATAGAPGRSESGGPWGRPEDAMKKIVWSEIDIEGEYDGILPHPPVNAGKFMDISASGNAFRHEDMEVSDLYGDIAVVAVKIDKPSVKALCPRLVASVGSLDFPSLTDNRYTDIQILQADPESGLAWIRYEFDEPVTVYGAEIAAGRFEEFMARLMLQSDEGAVLEYSTDGLEYKAISNIKDKVFGVAALGFAPVTAKYFRLSVKPGPGVDYIPVSEFNLFTAPRVNRYMEKAGFFPASDLYATATPMYDNTVESIDITSHMDSDGHLKWAPENGGKWKILRFGYSLTGQTNSPASPEATGFEVDKLDPEAVRGYFNHYLDLYEDATGGLMGRKGLHYIVTDSWEAGCLNWTPKMREEFRRTCGYDLVSWLPAVAGYVVGDPASSDRFLWDYRRAIADLIARNHYDLLTKILKERGMERYSESHELVRAFIADGMRVKKNAAIPMCAMWMGRPGELLTIGVSGADCRESASVAHLYGQKYVAAESLTSGVRAWGYCPEMLKERADLLLANGLNRFVIHESAHQPLDDYKPGFSLSGAGQMFTRHETWAEQAGAWMDYLARSSFMLQQGRFSADILYYFGEDNNVTNLYSVALPEIPEGYNFDFVNADAIVNDLKTKGGRIVAPSGSSYRIIVLGDNARMMSLPVLEGLEKLVRGGAVMVGAKPVATPSLSDDKESFDALAARLWNEPSGKGRVYDCPLDEVLEKEGLLPDVTWTKPSEDSKYMFVHRILGGGEHIYWLDSRTSNVEDIEAGFRVSGLEPEIWNPVTGTMEKASYSIEGDVTKVKLHFEPEDALFIVFRDKAEESAFELRKKAVTSSFPVSGAWNVAFENGLGAPSVTVFEELSDWSLNDNPYIRYYSGTAVYSKTVELPDLKGEEEVWLDLGCVKNVAEVSVNGNNLGVLWKTPWKVEVSDYLEEGLNYIEIKVVNLWLNRIIGDLRGDGGSFANVAFQLHSADEPLEPSGLIGPVRFDVVGTVTGRISMDEKDCQHDITSFDRERYLAFARRTLE
ncbi:MAG: glycoside hydrolase family 2 [Bacteroidales bacterium]|nr:glycoside hydrolase family 2 [Bacteroidales bacterium]